MPGARTPQTILLNNLWTDPEIETDYELAIWIYLLRRDLHNMLGVMDFSPLMMKAGARVTQGKLVKALGKFDKVDKIYFCDNHQKIWVPAMSNWILYGKSPSGNHLAGVQKLLKKFTVTAKNSHEFALNHPKTSAFQSLMSLNGLVFVRKYLQVLDSKYGISIPGAYIKYSIVKDSIVKESNLEMFDQYNQEEETNGGSEKKTRDKRHHQTSGRTKF